MTFNVYVYEPVIDPGGFQGVYRIEACNRDEAETEALRLARLDFTDNKGLEVWQTETLPDHKVVTAIAAGDGVRYSRIV